MPKLGQPGWRLAAGVLLVGLAGVGAELPLPSWMLATSRVVLLSVGLVAMTGSVIAWSTPSGETPVDPFLVSAVPPKNVQSLLRRTGVNALFGPNLALQFAHAISNPASCRQRLTEEYIAGSRTLTQRVFIDGKAAEAAKAGLLHAYIPVLVVPKSHHIDSLRVSGPNSEAVPVLPHAEYLEMVACALRLLLLSGHAVVRVSHLKSEVLNAEAAALAQIIQRVESSDTSGRKLRVKSDENPITRLLVDGISPQDPAILLAESLVEKLRHHYAVVARVPCKIDGRFSAAYEQVIVPKLETVKDRSVRWPDITKFVSLLVGAGPTTLTLGVENASTCRDYFLTVRSPEGMYLRSQTPISFERAAKTKSNNAPTLPLFRFRRRLGQGHAHFCARYFPDFPPGDSPRIRFDFAEVPPGGQLKALVAALGAFVACVLASLLSRREQDIGIAVVFLLLPAMASWVGMQSPARRLLDGAAKARLNLFFTTMTSVAAIALYVVTISYGAPLSVLPLTFYGTRSLAWLVLVAVSAAVLLFSTIEYWMQIRTYAQLSGRE